MLVFVLMERISCTLSLKDSENDFSSVIEKIVDFPPSYHSKGYDRSGYENEEFALVLGPTRPLSAMQFILHIILSWVQLSSKNEESRLRRKYWHTLEKKLYRLHPSTWHAEKKMNAVMNLHMIPMPTMKHSK